MRFMMIVKHAEKQGPPPKPLMDAIAKLAEEDSKKGKMLGSGGLGPTALGARVRLSGGQVTVTDGPFTEAKEVVGGYAIVRAATRDEAIALAQRVVDVHVAAGVPEFEMEIRPIFDAHEGCAP